MEDNNYYLSVFNESLLFSRKKFDRKIKYIDNLKEDEYLLSLISKIKKIKSCENYPEIAIENLKKIITYVKEKYPTNKYLNTIQTEYDELLKMNYNPNIYAYEAMIKFGSVNCVTQDFIDIDINLIEESMVFDFTVLETLLMDNKEIDRNYLYIASLKKFFHEQPQLFLDKNINLRAQKIVVKNNLDEESNHLLYKLKKIKKYQEKNYSCFSLKSLVDFSIIQGMLVNNQLYESNKDMIDETKIDILYRIIENEIIYSENMKRNAIDIISDYRFNTIDKLGEEQRKHYILKCNECIGMLNKMDFSYELDFASVLKKSYSVKTNTKSYDLEELIQDDLGIIIYLLSKDDRHVDYDTAHLTINKFLKFTPNIFDNEDIYERTMDVLKRKKIGTLVTKNKVKKIYKR